MNETKEIKKKKSIPVLIINAIIIAVFVFVCGCLCWIMAQIFTGNDPSLFGYKSMVVLTDSMTGTYDKGDVIIAKEFAEGELEKDPHKIKVGDVITFVAPEGFGVVDGYKVTHRVVEGPFEKDGKWYVFTKGDANPVSDNVAIPLSSVEGLVVGKSEFMASLQKVFRTWYGFLILIVIPLVAIGVWQIVYTVKQNNKQKKQKADEQAQEEMKKIEQNRLERERELKEQAIQEYLKQKEDKDKDGQ